MVRPCGVHVVGFVCGRIRGLAIQETVILGHILVMFRQRGSEEVSSLRIGHKIEIVGRRGIQRRAQRSFAGIADGTGRQAGMNDKCCKANRNANL